MPIGKYFLVVGPVLAALLLMASWSLPEPPEGFPDRPEVIDRANIRIKSARKWPEKLVLDTTRPATTRPAVAGHAVAQSGAPPLDEAPHQSNLETAVQLKPDMRSVTIDRPTVQIKRHAGSVDRSRRVARSHIVRRLARVELRGGCCQFGWFDNSPTSWNAVPRRRAASSLAD